MVGFELARMGSVGEIAREWRISRSMPLYLLGIAGGFAIGLGIAQYDPGDAATAAPVSMEAPGASGGITPALVSRDAVPGEKDTPLNISPALPEEFVRVFTLPAPPVAAPPVAVAPAPAAPAAPVQAAAPAAPQAPPAPAQPAAANPPAQAAAPADAGKANFYVPAVSGGGATTLEQELFDGINAERAKAGLPAYAYDAGLTKVARTRSQQMADQDYFAHRDPYGYTMYTELLAYFGYTSYAWAGENLAMNNYAAAEAAPRAVISLMNSPTHRANLLANDFFRIGIGEVTTADGRHIFSMIFLG
ncbi:MAG: CAP domain-containing protein [Dehalococcoidia bacterium]|nr:CAP domain-containing protein [Dehalococcoidia bacterium]